MLLLTCATLTGTATASALPDMDAQTTQTTPERTLGVTEAWLTRLETPGGIHGGPAAVLVEADAPNGDGAQEVAGSAGLDTLGLGVPTDSG